jgi:hypothetical protein
MGGNATVHEGLNGGVVQRYIVLDPKDSLLCGFWLGHSEEDVARKFAVHFGLFGIPLAVMPASGVSIERDCKWSWLVCGIDREVSKVAR